ncbi:MAG: 50S ribosomal protein L5 [Patescibacteria group bacterium]
MKQVNELKKLEKAVINIGIGKLRQQSHFEDKVLPEILKEIAVITGQKAAPRKTKKAIAGFKSREGDIVGLQVTLRRRRLKDFVTRVIRIVLPRVKDFRGLDLKNIDDHGNLNIGFREQFVFPEIEAEKSKIAFGLQVTIVPVFKNREKAIDLYKELGVPLRGLTAKK